MPFVKGKSGNPGGKPKGLAAVRDYIASKTRDGEALIDFHLAVMSGKGIIPPYPDAKPLYPGIRDMQASAEWLGDRYWGKAAQPVTGEGGEPISIQIVRKVPK